MKIVKNLCISVSLLISTAVWANPISIVVGNVTKKPIYEQVQTFGTLSAEKQVTISSEVAGKVSNVFYSDGQTVSKGDLLLQLDNTQAKADLISAQADLALAKRNYQRYEELSKYGGTTKQQLDKERADVNAKQATVQQDLNNLQKFTLTAPFSGRLGSFKVQRGDYVAVGDKIISVVNNSKLKVVYALPEDTFAQLKLGQQVIIIPSALSKQSFAGKVTYIAPSIDTSTGTISVQATLNNKKGKLSSGMFVNVRQIFSKSDALVIPEESLQVDLSGTYVFVIKNGKAYKTAVTTGTHVDGYVEVTSGLSLSQTIVTEGQQKLSSGMAVKVTGHWETDHKPQKSLMIHKKIAKTTQIKK